MVIAILLCADGGNIGGPAPLPRPLAMPLNEVVCNLATVTA